MTNKIDKIQMPDGQVLELSSSLELCDTDIVIRDDEKFFNQLQQMRHSTFDLSKLTVVGSPTITEDGVASGFSDGTNYILTPTLTITNYNTLVIKSKFTYSLTNGTIWWLKGLNIRLVTANSNGTLQLYQDSQMLYINNSEIGSPSANDVIETVTTITATDVTLKVIVNGNTFTKTATLSTSLGNIDKCGIGCSYAGYSTYAGSIDLKQFSITVDGKEVFSGNKTGLDVIKPDNYTVVGNPVISDDGVISYGSSGGNNRVKNFVNVILPEPLPLVSGQDNKNVYKFCVNFKYNNKEQSQPLFWFYPQNTPNSRIMYLSLNSTHSVDGIFTALFDKGYVTIPNLFHNGENYKLEYVTDLISYFSIYINGTFITTQTFVKSDINTTLNKICLAGTPDGTGGDCVSPIDLNSFKIYVDGNLVYQPCLKIPYTQSKTGSKIVDVAYRDRVIDLYEQEGKAKYYTIDESNKNFTLPMGEIYGMIENIKNTNGGGGLEICDISMALYIDETKGLRRYLNGQIVDINTNTQAFLNRLLEIKNTNPDYFATEENWQSEALLNIDGCVYKFVLNYSGETVVSVRLPKYPDYVEINAGGTLPVVGNGMTLGITNGSGTAGFYHYQANTAYVNVDISRYGTPVGGSVSNNSGTLYGGLGVTTDPTKSGIQTTLKQTKLKLRYFIQIATGSETENNIINEIELNNPFSLFDSKYSDHESNNLSWLKSEGQWNAKAVYTDAYDKLLKVYNGTESVEGLSVKLSTETYTDYDFVLNTAEETFRLPLKTKQKFYDDIAPVVGNGMALGLTNGTTNGGVLADSTSKLLVYTGAYGSNVQTGLTGQGSTIGQGFYGVTTDPTKSGLETHLTENTDLYLYFYVGETVQNANLIDAGRIGEQLANKQDKCIHIIDTYVNGTSGYRIWSDGYCEQWGASVNASNVTFLKKFINTDWNFVGGVGYPKNNYGYDTITNKTVSGFTFFTYTANLVQYWRVCGYLAEGEY